MTIGDIIPLFLKLFAQSWGLCFLAIFACMSLSFLFLIMMEPVFRKLDKNT
jgi:hypothetical protein